MSESHKSADTRGEPSGGRAVCLSDYNRTTSIPSTYQREKI
jgi:hypothetical protein